MDKVSMNVPAGEIFGFIGPNGAGKTTTIRMMATLLEPDEGRVLVDGIDVVEAPSEVRKVLGFMPDSFGVYDRITVDEYLEFFAASHGIALAQRKRTIEAVMELTEGRGADVAFEVIGLPATIRQAFDLTRKGGETVIVGVPRLDQTMEFNPGMDFVIMEKTLKGCWYGGANVHQDVPMLVELYKNGGLKLDELVSNTVSLDQVNAAMDAMGQGNIARSVIVY